MANKFQRIDPDADEDEIRAAILSPAAMITPAAVRKLQDYLHSQGHHHVAQLLDSFAYREPQLMPLAEVVAALDEDDQC